MDIAPILKEILLMKAYTDAQLQAVRKYFQLVWQESFPGELYVGGEMEINQFTTSLVAATCKSDSCVQ